MPAIVFFLLFILPFVIAPFGVTQFENPKIIFAEFGIILLFLIAIFKNKFPKQFINPQLFLLLSAFILTLVDLLFLRTQISFFGNAFRMQGIFLLWILMLFSILSSKITFKKIPWFVYSLLLLAELIAIFFLPTTEANRYVGTIGEPNALASFAIFLWPFTFFAIQPKADGPLAQKTKILEKIGVLLTLLTVIAILILSGSRSATVAFGIQLIFIFLNKFKFPFLKIVFICVFIYLISYTFPFFQHNPYENRIDVWKSAIFAGLSNPIIGNGFGNSEIALHNSAALLNLPIQYYYFDSSHNIFLDWWVQGGIIGFEILVGLIIFTLKNFIEVKNIRNLVLLFGLLTCLSFNPTSVVGLLGFWWIIGQGFILPDKVSTGDQILL